MERQLPARKAKIYYGRPENQRDPSAKIVDPRPPKKVPPHSSLYDASFEAIFAQGIVVRETNPYKTFTPSLTSSIEIARFTYSRLSIGDIHLSRTLLPEYLDYYATSLIWMRIVTLKAKNSQPLTKAEQSLLRLIQRVSLNVPEPLYRLIMSIGKIKTRTGSHLTPSFPSLPEFVINHFGGHYGELHPPAPGVDNSIHNLYEEIPCLGVTSYAVSQSLSQAPPGHYDSLVTYQGQQPNRNLLGFRPLAIRRDEAKNFAFAADITDETFPSCPPNVAFNLDFLMTISSILASTKAFKIRPVVFSTLSTSGGMCQIVIERPQLTADSAATPAVKGEIQPTCLIKETDSVFGEGLFFCNQLMKESYENNHQSWAPFAQIPQEWIENRNERRNLPLEYLSICFLANSLDANSFRMSCMEKMNQDFCTHD